MSDTANKILFDKLLSDEIATDSTITKEAAIKLFNFFRDCPLFRWKDANNDCEDRANAICIILDEWKIPNYKGWVFSGRFLKRETGNLINLWNYHVAPLLPVKDESTISYYIIDPATLSQLETIDYWGASITASPFSYYIIKQSEYYIFPGSKITKDNWFKRNKQNYKWTIQGLSGINGVSKIGKAQVCFNKSYISKVEKAFKTLKSSNCPFK